MTAEEKSETKKPARKRADAVKPFLCKNLIAVIEDPQNPRNICTVIRNVNALGLEKVYVVDPRPNLNCRSVIARLLGHLPRDWRSRWSPPGNAAYVCRAPGLLCKEPTHEHLIH